MDNRTMTYRRHLVVLLALVPLMLGYIRPAASQSPISPLAVGATAPREVLDQSQPVASYGYWFEDDMIRWQAFIPRLPNVAAVEVFISKYGEPGNVIVEVRTADGTLLAERTLAQADVPADEWARVEFSTPVPVTPGTKYRIHVYADTDSPTPENRYVWRGSSDSTYNPDCGNDVSATHPAYDYAFKTYSLVSFTYLPLVSNN